MQITEAHQNLKSAVSQRNVLIVIGGILLLSNIVLSICLFTQKQKTIIVPANLQKELEFSGNEVSISYLEEMTTLFSNLLLDLTPKNIAYKSKLVLRYVEPGAYHDLQSYFDKEEKKHKEYNLVSNFSLTEMNVIPDLLSVDIYGVLISKFGSEGTKEQNVVYRISYKNVGGKLLITGFTRNLK